MRHDAGPGPALALSFHQTGWPFLPWKAKAHLYPLRAAFGAPGLPGGCRVPGPVLWMVLAHLRVSGS